MVPVTIIGGGIGGLTLANALQHFGIPFGLYERAPELTEVGAGIGITESPVKILGWLGLEGSFREKAVSVGEVFMPDKNLNIRRRIRPTSEMFCIHRAKLIDVLKEKLPANNIHLSMELRDVQVSDIGTKLIFDGDGIETNGCVVAADGIQSVVRRKLVPDISVRYINQVIWRGISPVTLPKPFDSGYLEIWDEGLRFLAIPISEGHTFWLGVERAVPGGQDNPSTLIDGLLERFRNFHPALLELIRETGPVLRNDMGDLGTKRRPWHVQNVCFLGDAIHATTPNLGQGGCQSMEDAWCLANCLNKYQGDMRAAFAKYQELREPKAMKIVSDSWMFGRAAHSRNPFLHYGYRLILTKSPEWVLRKQEAFLKDLSYLERV